mgnify:CR=1 FL=1
MEIKEQKNFILVIFGASGDLTWRKLIPALYDMLRKGTEAAEETAAQTLTEVKRAMQIDYFG